MPASAFPSNVRQAGPISLRTHGLVNRDARYSYTDTPTDLQRPNFQSASSPVNSMIAESPMPLAGGAIPNHPEQLPTPRFPVEKTVLAGVDSPYSPESLHEVHPALYAPFAEPAKLSGEADITDVRESAKPGSNKTDDQLTSLTYGSTYAPSNTEPTRSLSGTIHGSTFYNPDSLAGTNVALENHRPGQVSHPNAMVDPKWKHSLCEIDSLCCAGLFCPCVVYGKTQYRLSRREQKQDPTDLLSYQSVNGSCGMMAAACGLQCKQFMSEILGRLSKHFRDPERNSTNETTQTISNRG